jgi:Subtilisin inhibitor-like
MRTRYLTTMTAAALAAMAFAGGAAAARPAPTLLRLSLANGEAAAPPARLVWLGCAPPAGTHPRSRAACGTLAAVHGDFAALHVTNGICTALYAPVTVTANGRWKGQPVRYRHTFGNACVLRNETGPVFRI